MKIFQLFSKVWTDILSLPKSFYVNFKLFPFKIAIKFPIWVSCNTQLGRLYKNTVKIEAPIKPKMIRFGCEGMNVPGNTKGSVSIEKGADIVFKGYASFARGTVVRVDGQVVFGNYFSVNSCSFISCSDQMNFGDDVLIGWHVHIRDTDGHTIVDEHKNEKPRKKPINIGNHVWIGAFAHVLRGVNIPDDCVVAYRSTVLHSFEESGCIIGGYPAKVIKRNSNWKK